MTSIFRKTITSIAALITTATVSAQQIIGTQGMMNIPTADMNVPGTFVGGISYLQSNSILDGKTNVGTEQKPLYAPAIGYDTGLYYIDFTPFKWMEITYRETLLRDRDSSNPTHYRKGFRQQDRSTTLRLRPLWEREGKWWPSVVIGGNDFYSDNGKSYYTCVYGVLTKHINIKGVGAFGITAGYEHSYDTFLGLKPYHGPFGGIEYRPAFFRDLRIMAEYDSNKCNIGAQVQLFRHLNAMAFLNGFKKVCAGISYQYTIKY